MSRIVIASMREDAGKTGLVVGLAQVAGRPFGYLKPFGDRLVYRKKAVWDHDCAVVVSAFALREQAHELTIGFEQQKLRYMYDKAAIEERLRAMAARAESERDVLFIEAGQDLCYGSFVHLDALTLARQTGGKLVVVVAGDDSRMLDELAFLKRNVALAGVQFGGIVANKVRNLEDFRDTVLPEIEALGIPVFGTLPLELEFESTTVDYYAQRLMTRVLCGEAGLGRKVRHVFVGAMSAAKALEHPLFQKEGKLVITGGDRDDMLLAALETHAVAVLLTNNVMPHPSILAKFSERGLPLLLTPRDTLTAVTDFQAVDALLTPDDKANIALWKELVGKHVDIEKLLA